MVQYKIPESDTSKFAMEWAISRLGHGLNYYSTADALLNDFLPKYNEAMAAIKQYNQSTDS